MDMFQIRRDKDQKIQELDKQIQLNKKIQKDQEELITELTEWKKKLGEQVDDLERQKTIIENELTQKEKMIILKEEFFTKEKNILDEKLSSLKLKFSRKIPFDEEKRVECLAYNIPKLTNFQVFVYYIKSITRIKQL